MAFVYHVLRGIDIKSTSDFRAHLGSDTEAALGSKTENLWTTFLATTSDKYNYLACGPAIPDPRDAQSQGYPANAGGEGVVAVADQIIAPIPDYDSSRSFHERQKRRHKDLARLSTEAQSIFLALPHYRIKDCDDDGFAERLRLCLGTTEVTPFPIRTPAGSMVIVVIPNRIWFDLSLRRRLWALRKSSVSGGRPTVRLVTQRWIRRQPFLDNCKLVARCASFKVSASDRCLVQKVVDDDPLATLEDCADAVRGPDPYGAVFALIAAGLLKIDFESAITPASRVEKHAVER